MLRQIETAGRLDSGTGQEIDWETVRDMQTRSAGMKMQDQELILIGCYLHGPRADHPTQSCRPGLMLFLQIGYKFLEDGYFQISLCILRVLHSALNMIASQYMFFNDT